jgi:2-succinyl-6-hydroxy-2,4-cyclohexadiene-1-carboxylate synthase
VTGRRPLHSDTHPGDGPPVLFVHGFLSSRAHWLPNLDALRTVCTPVVVELYGHGRSPVADEPTPAAYVEEFDRLRAAHGVDSWAVVGQSLGGALCLHYALALPERVERVVITNSASAFATDGWVEQMLSDAESQAAAIESAGRRFLDEHPMHPLRGRRTPEHVRAELVADYSLHRPEGIAALVRHTAPTSSVRARAAAIEVPVLLTVGAREESFEPARRFATATIPDLTVVELAAGHNVNLHDVDGWNAAVCAFLRG